MAKSEKTSSRLAKKASRTLSNPDSSARAKSLAGSALSQASSKKRTSAKVAKRAGKTLADGKSSKAARSLAGSVLTQAPSKRGKPSSARTTTSAGRAASSALTQHVSTRRTAAGKSVRVVLKPIKTGSLTRDRVDKVVVRVLTARTGKKR